jgi:hypothetical protein
VSIGALYYVGKPGTSHQKLSALHFGGNCGLALAAVVGSVAIIIAILTALGTEARGIVFAKAKTVVSQAADAAIAMTLAIAFGSRRPTVANGAREAHPSQ